MSVTTTDNLGLSLPEDADYYSVDLYNENFQKIDSALKNFDGISKETKREISDSPLGQALSLKYDEDDPSNSSTWEEITDSLRKVSDNGELNWTPTSDALQMTVPAGYYSGGTLDCSSVYEQGKKDALKLSGGLQMYPAANGVDWSGSNFVKAYNASSSSSASTSYVTQDMVDLTNVSTITAMFSGDINPTNKGSGGTKLGSGKATLSITRGNGNAVTESASFSTGKSTKAVIVNVQNLTGNYLVQVDMVANGGSITNTAGRTWGSASTVTMTSCNANA